MGSTAAFYLKSPGLEYASKHPAYHFGTFLHSFRAKPGTIHQMSENADIKLLGNVGTHLPNCSGSNPRKPYPDTRISTDNMCSSPVLLQSSYQYHWRRILYCAQRFRVESFSHWHVRKRTKHSSKERSSHVSAGAVHAEYNHRFFEARSFGPKVGKGYRQPAMRFHNLQNNFHTGSVVTVRLSGHWQ